MIGKSADQIKIARRKLVEKGNRFIPSFFSLQIERNALSEESMQPDPGGKSIVSLRITLGVFHPKIAVEQGIDIHPPAERLDFETVAQRDMPGNIVLLQCHRGHGMLVRVAGNETE